MIETFLINSVLGKRTRRETLNGREYLVAPATLIVSGVLPGSGGPLYYPADEIGKNPSAWNHMPLVVYHPTDSLGNPVSARSPEVLSKSGIGFVFSSRYSKKHSKLSSELWFDVEATKRVNPQVLSALERGQAVELSTGLFLDRAGGPGVFNSPFGPRKYDAEARNYRPDHVAILPDQVGACPISEGCGVFNCEGSVLVANSLVTNPYPNEHAARVVDPSAFQKDSFRRKQIAPGVSVILGKKPGSEVMEIQAYRFKRDKFTISQAKAWLKKHKAKHKSFHAATGEGEPTDNSNSDNDNPGGDMKLTDQQRKDIVTFLTANCDCWKHKDDAGILNGFSDEKLTKLKEETEKAKQAEAVANAARQGFAHGDVGFSYDPAQNKFVANKKRDGMTVVDNYTPPDEDDEEEEDEPEPPKKKKGKKTMNQATPPATPKQLTEAEWMASAPPGIQSAVRNAMQIEANEKQALIARLTANVQDAAGKQALATMLLGKPLDELRMLSALTPPAPNAPPLPPVFLGGGVPPAPVGNQVDENDILTLPTTNWAEEAQLQRRNKA